MPKSMINRQSTPSIHQTIVHSKGETIRIADIARQKGKKKEQSVTPSITVSIKREKKSIKLTIAVKEKQTAPAVTVDNKEEKESTTSSVIVGKEK